MAVAEMEYEVSESELRRHERYWTSFVRFLTASAIVAIIGLAGMALFLV